MTNPAPPPAKALSDGQRRALEYLRANPGATTRAVAVALDRGQMSMLDTLQLLEGRGLVRSSWANRPGTTSFAWTLTEADHA